MDWQSSTAQIGRYFKSENSGLHSDAIFSLTIDDDKTIWLGFYDSFLSNFDISLGKVIKTYNLSNTGIIHNMVGSIAEDDHLNKWISSNGSLAKFDGKEWFIYDTTNFDLIGFIIY